ncbi:MAG: SDR family NAD(P)-dependent oxidoreductase [Bacteroidales bacterium]|nr:SDR family NAD(P)-dependent oxidoreductase [Candidatus Cryptobacteroides equifaecalis]
MRDFRNRSVLITGASSGIGAAMAEEFASRGAALIITGRNEARLEEVKERCIAAGACRVQTAVLDMTSEASIDAFASALQEIPDCLVLNAGISQRSEALETDESVVRKVMETNFFGPVRLTMALADKIKAAEFMNIAVTTSISGLFGFPLRSAYCASKHALFGWYESLQTENSNIRVTFLIPGRINTPISLSALHGDGKAHGQMDPGQQNGMPAEKCARIAVNAIARGRRRKLIGGVELIMAYLKKWAPGIFWMLAGRVSSK